MREWRNWQTRTFEGRVVHTIRVQVPSLAPNSEGICLRNFYFIQCRKVLCFHKMTLEVYFMNRNIPEHVAIARIAGSIAYPDIKGYVRFTQMKNGVFVSAEVSGLPCERQNGSCIYGFHIHSGESCGGNETDPFADSDGHYNPDGSMHPYHAGDLPPLFGNHGYAYMSVFTDRFSVNDIIGKTVIIHKNPDDFTTQPSGNSGEKIACGIILPENI